MSPVSLAHLAFYLATFSLSQALAVPATRPGGVLYSLDNNHNGAMLVAMALSDNGSIADTNLIPTGGDGLVGTTGPGQPPVGNLFGADSVVVEDNFIFVVNPGSNTVSMFTIDPRSPLRPTLVGRPVDTQGEFPMSLTYSSALNMVCVLNGGAIAGVSCFSVSSRTGLTPLDTRPRGLAPILTNQATPPVGPFLTASDITFNPSSSALIASIKGAPPSPATSNTTASPAVEGALFAWPVLGNGTVARNATITRNAGLILDFSLNFLDSDFSLLLVDPALGADVLSVSSPSLNISVVEAVNVTTQAAACWSVYDNALGLVFLIDAARTNVTVLSAVDGSIAGIVNYSIGGADGGLDSVIVGRYLYVLGATGGAVAVISLEGILAGVTPRQVQTFETGVPGVNATTSRLAGLAAWAP